MHNPRARIIGHREFLDGTIRPIFEDGSGQFTVGDDGNPVYGVFLMPIVDEADIPIIVTELPPRQV